MGAYESVDVYVLDDTALHSPVSGMLVRVFDSTGTTFFAQDTTDVDGRVGFTLWSQQYTLRFYKEGAQVRQPQVMDVVEGGTNTFDAYATVFVHPISNDPRLCRCSGFFRDITGAPHPWLGMYFLGQFSPILLEGAAVLSERRSIRTNEAGYACIDLIRGACYEATIEGFEDTQRQVAVPDSPSANLPDMLFPVVEEVTFDTLGPYLLSVGGTLELTPTVLTSTGIPLVGTASSDVQWLSSDDSILAVAVTDTTLVLTALAVGTAELQVRRLDQSIIRIPLTEVQGVPQTVVVS